ncbi:hypothetical protein [Nocardioides sp.]|uniref:DUF7937 domain-containing protein n=1 Tax=Nocardioides sp. TaxID=35761 RepID=UPI003513A9E7
MAGQPLSHVVLDVLGVTLLLVSLALPWNQLEDTTGVWWALLAVLVSTLTVAVPYVVALGLVPGLTAVQGRLLSLFGAVPVVLATVLTLVLSVPRADDPDYGVGSAVAVALFGVLLLALPRGAAPGDAALLSRALPLVAGLALAAAVLTSLATFVAAVVVGGDGLEATVLTRNSDLGSSIAASALFDDGEVAAVLLLLAVTFQALVVLGLPLRLVLGGRGPGRRLLAVVGLSALAALLFNSRNVDDLGAGGSIFLNYGVATYLTPVAGLTLLLAATALALNPAVRAGSAAADQAVEWVETARGAMLLAVGGALGLAVFLIAIVVQIAMFDGDLDIPAGLFVGLFFALLAAVAAGLSLPALASHAPRGPVALSLAAATLALGLVAVLAASQAGEGDGVNSVVTYPVLAGLFVMPGLAIFALTAPPSVRARFGSMMPNLTPAAGAAGTAVPPMPSGPAGPPAPPAPPGSPGSVMPPGPPAPPAPPVG